MNEEIKVSVVSWGPNRPLMMKWRDPISGKRRTKATDTYDWGEAERQAGEQENKLRAGLGVVPSRITWQEFLDRYQDEKLNWMKDTTRRAYLEAFHHVTRLLNPDRLAKLNTAAITTLVGRFRKEAMIPTTIAKHLRSLKAAFRWAHRQGYLATVPQIDMPKATDKMKGRAIAGEEFERMLSAVPKIRPEDPETWSRLLNGLWLSGLRISEAFVLSWDDGPFRIELGGRHPAFHIQGTAQKSGRTEICPMTPDFAEWLLNSTPPDERQGPVFAVPTGTVADAGKVISTIGETAGVVVSKETRKVREWVHNKKGKRTGARRLVEKEVVKYASAHDLRRSFGSRWSRKVMPAVLKRLMRHANIATTEQYYIDLNADEVASDLWREHSREAGVNRSVNNRPESETLEENGKTPKS